MASGTPPGIAPTRKKSFLYSRLHLHFWSVYPAGSGIDPSDLARLLRFAFPLCRWAVAYSSCLLTNRFLSLASAIDSIGLCVSPRDVAASSGSFFRTARGGVPFFFCPPVPPDWVSKKNRPASDSESAGYRLSPKKPLFSLAQNHGFCLPLIPVHKSTKASWFPNRPSIFL